MEELHHHHHHLFLFLLIFTSSISITTQFTLTRSLYYCSNSTTNSTLNNNSSFKQNLNTVLESLASNSKSPNGYYNTTAGKFPTAIYGSYSCKGDLSPEECSICVIKATQTVLIQCPGSDSSVLWYDQCMLRYSNHSFFSIMEREPLLAGYNEENVIEADEFKILLSKTTEELKDNLVKKFSKLVKKYAEKEGKFRAGGASTLYTMAQCTPDIDSTDCEKCVEMANAGLPVFRQGKIGGRVLLPNCFVRYELYRFYGFESTGEKSRLLGWKAIVGVAVAAGVVVLVMVAFFILQKKERTRKKNHNNRQDQVGAEISELHARQFSLSAIEAATDNFSFNNKLGEGGFGPVYKGKLTSGAEIAAKRLSLGSGQGAEEFKNEVELVAKLQHRNLVRLLGFSLESEERILVYEFVTNGSLDYTLFDPKISSRLDWSTRYKIMLGVARGLLYLHEDSRLKIIHRDLKASNILLDEDMNPKISDFGMARMFCSNQTQGSTNRIVGTYGYMSPEYMMHGNFSVKSDVFSFGVLVLEIVTGKKNSTFGTIGSEEGLLGYVWKHWSNDRPSEVVDPSLGNDFSVNEAIRCIHIGLLCVQDDEEDRPSMDSVVLMLNRDSISLPLPHQSSFFFPSRSNKKPLPNPSTRTLMPWSTDEALDSEVGSR